MDFRALVLGVVVASSPIAAAQEQRLRLYAEFRRVANQIPARTPDVAGSCRRL